MPMCQAWLCGQFRQGPRAGPGPPGLQAANTPLTRNITEAKRKFPLSIMFPMFVPDQIQNSRLCLEPGLRVLLRLAASSRAAWKTEAMIETLPQNKIFLRRAGDAARW